MTGFIYHHLYSVRVREQAVEHWYEAEASVQQTVVRPYAALLTVVGLCA